MLTRLFGFVACLGCGGAQLVLEQPINDQCEGAGLQGCKDLTAGVLLYVEGNKQEGLQKIEQGVATNMESPKELKQFAEGMKLLKQLPGVGQYVAALEPVLDVIPRAADEAEKNSAARGGAAGDDEGEEASESNASEEASSTAGTGGTRARNARPSAGVIVAAAGDTDPCNALSGSRVTLPEGETACVAVLTSLRILTDVHVSPACPHDVIVLAGAPDMPSWFLLAPASRGMSVHGAAYPVHKTQALVVALQRRDPERAWNEVGCAVTWAGRARGKR